MQINLSVEQVQIIIAAIKAQQPAKDTEPEILCAMFEDVISDMKFAPPLHALYDFTM